MNRRLWIASVVILAALGFLVFQGLGNATVFFKTADEAVRDKAELGNRRFRVQGTVKEAPRPEGNGYTFEIEEDGGVVPVVYRGEQSFELVKPGIPVVLEGRWADDGSHYASNLIMVKHTESYRVDNPDRVKDYPPEQSEQ